MLTAYLLIAQQFICSQLFFRYVLCWCKGLVFNRAFTQLQIVLIALRHTEGCLTILVILLNCICFIHLIGLDVGHYGLRLLNQSIKTIHVYAVFVQINLADTIAT